MKKFFSLIILVFFLASCSSGRSSSAPDTTVALSENTTSAPMTSAPTESITQDESGTGEAFQDNESYLDIRENKNQNTNTQSVITFSLKVDTASYRNIVRYINSENLPPHDAVRIEEMLNYFKYDEKLSNTESPFSIYTEIGKSPFDVNKYLAFVRVKSRDIDKELLPKSNLTFLIDTSGSMDSYDKLPLLKSSFELLVETLTEDDVVSIVTYAGSSRIALDSVSGADKHKILDAINNLEAGGSTAGADGINTAYSLAEKNFKEDGNNRIILATDGDFNVGVSSIEGLENLIKRKKDSGVYLSILGFGTGNIRDDIMETLSKHGNGNYSYIDSVKIAEKVLVDEVTTNMFTIADDVKAQVEFNPNEVASYRLIGYENRKLANEDFEDDTKDAGEIGIGTDVVLMFEMGLKSSESSSLKYSVVNNTTEEKKDDPFKDELFEVRIRYKNPGENESLLIKSPVKNDSIKESNTSDFNFAKSVASFGHILRNSEYSENLNIDDILKWADDSRGEDERGYRKEFIDVLRRYKNIKRN